MRWVWIIILLLIVAGGSVGFYAYRNLQVEGENKYAQGSVKLTGELKSISGGGEYKYVLATEDGRTIGVVPVKISFDDFKGKNVEVAGQYSGTVLYVDEVKELP